MTQLTKRLCAYFRARKLNYFQGADLLAPFITRVELARIFREDRRPPIEVLARLAAVPDIGMGVEEMIDLGTPAVYGRKLNKAA